MKAGPKTAVDASPLPLRSSRRRELAVARFALDHVRVPRGHGVRKPFRLRPWQRELVALTWDGRPRPRLAGWMLPRGQGKTSLVAVLALFELFAGEDGAQVVVVATDERQAGLCFRAAVRMVELNRDLGVVSGDVVEELHGALSVQGGVGSVVVVVMEPVAQSVEVGLVAGVQPGIGLLGSQGQVEALGLAVELLWSSGLLGAGVGAVRCWGGSGEQGLEDNGGEPAFQAP